MIMDYQAKFSVSVEQISWVVFGYFCWSLRCLQKVQRSGIPQTNVNYLGLWDWTLKIHRITDPPLVIGAITPINQSREQSLGYIWNLDPGPLLTVFWQVGKKKQTDVRCDILVKAYIIYDKLFLKSQNYHPWCSNMKRSWQSNFKPPGVNIFFTCKTQN